LGNRFIVESESALSKVFCVDSDCPSSCFPGESTVQLQDGSVKHMAELRVGDNVLSAKANGELVYSPVVTFMHVERHVNASYLLLRHALGEITISEDHMIFVSSDSSGSMVKDVIASQVKVGDFFWTPQRAAAKNAILVPSPVREIVNVQRVGMFSPLTVEGTLVVDGTLTSSFTGYPCTESRPDRCKGGQHARRLFMMRYFGWFMNWAGILESMQYGQLPGKVIKSQLAFAISDVMKGAFLLG